jgi:hypothetical protein
MSIYIIHQTAGQQDDNPLAKHNHTSLVTLGPTTPELLDKCPERYGNKHSTMAELVASLVMLKKHISALILYPIYLECKRINNLFVNTTLLCKRAYA